MGSSIPMALGLKTARVDEPVIAIIGESTFYHAGMPGLLNAVHNKIPITIIIADNGITAMTGHQPNPSTGRTLMGDETKIIYPEKIAESFGVENIKVVDPFDLDSTINAIEEGIKSNTLALIVCRHPCPIELRREHKLEQKKVKVEGCTGCRLCIDELGCPGMEWKDGELAINGICIGCGLCTQICPFEAIKLE
jgi:indolepyruvate ferredoxin oxidoreductase alpha subunit